MPMSFGHSERNHKFTKGQNLRWHALEMSLWSFKDANVHIALTLVAVFIGAIVVQYGESRATAASMLLMVTMQIFRAPQAKVN